jgi:carbon-monoxide dehydrogenase small subunit
MVDDQVVRGCLTLAVQMQGRTVDTIEGLSDRGELARLQQAFLEHNAFQCGYCSSGMLMTALEIVRHHPQASRDDIRDLISGNYCRCTGYQAIVDAIESVLAEQRLLPPQAAASGAAS